MTEEHTELEEYGADQGLFNSISAFFQNRVVIYTLRRILVMIPLFLGVSILTFSMVKMIGDPTDLVVGAGAGREEMLKIISQQFGLNKPVTEQYYIWLKKFVTWQFGYSGIFKVKSPAPMVNKLIYQTAKMQYAALFLSIIISIPLGIQAAKKRGTTSDTLVSAIAIIGLSMPIYVSGIVLIKVFGGGGLNWFPVAGANTPHRDEVNWSNFFSNFDYQSHLWWTNSIDSLVHLTLPLIALTFASLSLITRLMRSNMLEVLKQDYILAARANGIEERVIIWKHALRNAILPIVTFVGLSIGAALGGAPITETVFSWPGLGKTYVQSIQIFDMSLILGITMIITVMIFFSNLATDLFYAVVDPRLTI